MIRVRLLEGGAEPDVDAAAAQHLQRGVAQLLAHLGHHLLGQVQQQEPHRARIKAHLPGRRVGQRPQLRDQFGARVRRADHHDGAPGRRHPGIVLDVGQLQLFDEVVPQIQRLGGGLQPAGMPGQPGDVEQLGHRSGREHQPVPGHGMAAFLGVAVGQGVPGEVDRVHPAAHGVHAAQRIGQRHSDEPRVDHPAGDVGQQRCVQHVVDGGDHCDVHRRPAQRFGQPAGTGESGEAASHDHNGGHRPECRRRGRPGRRPSAAAAAGPPRKPLTSNHFGPAVGAKVVVGSRRRDRPGRISVRRRAARFVIRPCASLSGS